MRLFSGRTLFRDLATLGALMVSMSAGHYFGLPFWTVIALCLIAIVGAYLLVEHVFDRRRIYYRSSHRRKTGQGAMQIGRWQFTALVAMVMATAFVAVFFWPGTSGTQTPALLTDPANAFTCRVTNVHDGDTLRCQDGTRVRLHAVAARELDESCRSGHPCPAATGAAAQRALSDLALGQVLNCEQTGTSYERVTAICRNEKGIEINCEMVNNGLALIWPKFNDQRAICEAAPSKATLPY